MYGRLGQIGPLGEEEGGNMTVMLYALSSLIDQSLRISWEKG